MIAMSKRSLLDEKFWECLNFVELNEPTNPDIRNQNDGDDNDDDCLVAGPQRTGRGQKPASACSPKDQAIILIIITNNPPIIIGPDDHISYFLF